MRDRIYLTKTAKQFLSAQCPGCVESWPYCSLHETITHKGLDDSSKSAIKKGRCPFRVNGTTGLDSWGFTKIDLSEIADSEASQVFLKCVET